MSEQVFAAPGDGNGGHHHHSSHHRSDSGTHIEDNNLPTSEPSPDLTLGPTTEPEPIDCTKKPR